MPIPASPTSEPAGTSPEAMVVGKTVDAKTFLSHQLVSRVNTHASKSSATYEGMRLPTRHTLKRRTILRRRRLGGQ